MKKILISLCVFALGITLTGAVAHAAFNNDPQDYGTVLVANSTKNPFPGGTGVGGWTPSVSADAGEAVSVQIYYHNTGPNTANDVRLVLSPQSDTPSTVHTFSARVIADGTTVASGSATVYTSSTQSLSFIPGSVSFAPNQLTTGYGVSNELSLFGSGFSAGSVAPGWSTQGTLVASFRVSNNSSGGGSAVVDNCAINAFAPDQSSVTRGNSTILRWNTSGCTNVQVWPSIGSANAIDSRTITPTDSTTYTLSAQGADGTMHTKTTTVVVTTLAVTDNCIINSFTADQASIQQGSSTVLRWNTSGCTNVQVWPTVGSVASSGYSLVSPQASTTYTLTAYGADSTVHTKTVVVAVTAVTVTDACAINAFAPDQSSISRGNSTILRWNTSGCINVQVWPSIGSANAIDSRTITPTDSTTYTLSAQGADGTMHTKTTTVVVTTAATNDFCYISYFNADASSIQNGDSTTLHWGTNGCARAEVWPSVGSTSTTGTFVVSPSVSTKYVLNAYGADGTLHSQSVTINVGATRVTDTCAINSFTADTYSVTAGNSSILRWSTSGCARAEIYPDLGQVNTTGAHSVTPNASTAYVLNAYGADGTIHTQTVTVYVTANPVQPSNPNPTPVPTPVPTDTCFINSFTANNYTISYGNYATLSWNTSGCVAAQLAVDGLIATSVNTSDFGSVAPSYTTTYTLNAYGQGGTLHTRSLTISVLNYNYNNNNNYYYNNNTNTNYCSIYNFTADNYTVNAGNQTTLRWNTNGLNSISISPNYYGYNNTQNSSGSMTVTPYVTTTYTLTGYGCGTSYTRSVTVNVSTSSNTNTAPQAVTTIATPLTPYSAQLNGLAVPNTASGTTSAWFEWGTTGSLGSRTNTQTVNSYVSSSSYSDIVQGLVPGQYYYYRAVVQNQNGTSYGDLYRFQPLATTTTTVVNTQTTNTPPTHVIVRNQTVRNVVSAQSAPSLLSLKVQSNYDRMCVGGSMEYVVTYQNVSAHVLGNTVLQVKLPGELDYVSSTNGQYDTLTRTVTIPLGDVAVGAEGTVTVHATVNSTAVVGKLVVMTATVVYTNPTTHAQENAIAYSLVSVTNDCPSVLGASVFGFGSFLPTTLLGWLLLILIILALIVLARQLYRKPKVQTPAIETVREIR